MAVPSVAVAPIGKPNLELFYENPDPKHSGRTFSDSDFISSAMEGQLTMVQRKRSSELCWPIVAVGAIVLLLLLGPRLQHSVRPFVGEVIRPVARQAVASTRPLFLPKPLEVAPPKHEGLHDLATAVASSEWPRNRRVAGHSLGTSVVQSAPLRTHLHAPLRNQHDELAGLSDSELALPVATTARRTLATQAAARMDREVTFHAVPALQREDVGDIADAWPPTPSLDQLLEEAASIPDAQTWTADVRAALGQLRALPTISHAAAGAILQRLSRLADQGLADAEQQAERSQQKLWLRAAHAVDRRLAAWLPIWKTTRRAPTQLAAARFSVDLNEVQRLAKKASDACQATNDQSGWSDYLLLHHLDDPRLAMEPSRRQIIAQRVLSRLEWEGLDAEQLAWLEKREIQDLAAAIRPWAAGPVDYTRLLHQLERQESDAVDLASIDVATATQTLRFAGGSQTRRVAAAIDAHYRNANLRLSISDELLMRLLPAVPDETSPIRETVLGTQVAGTSHVASTLQLRLKPDDRRWSFDLVALGNINAAIHGRQGPVSVRNSNRANFVASTPITITPWSIRTGDATVELNHASRLRGMTTEFDSVPLLGSLVRSIAMAQYQEIAPQVRRISGEKMQQRISSQVEEKIEQQVERASSQLNERLLGPLATMRLAPTVVDLRTDEHRLTARYRLAGDWQLAAFTPRPRAPSDSSLSVQFHQSALNNVFERLLASSESRSIRSIAEELVTTFGGSAGEVPADIPADVRIQFAKTRPITVEVDDDRLMVTFRIVRLHNEAGLDLRHFIVRATYRPQVEGMQASFVRDGHLSVSGNRMSLRSRVPVRAIFEKVLSESRPLPLISPQLAEHPAVGDLRVRQFELRDGWVGLAIGPAAYETGEEEVVSAPSRIARRPIAD